MESGKTTRLQARGHITTIMVPDIRDNGWTTYNMATGWRHGWTAADMKATTIWGRSMAKGSMCGKIAASMMVIGSITRSQAKGFTSGLMEGDMKGIG